MDDPNIDEQRNCIHSVIGGPTTHKTPLYPVYLCQRSGLNPQTHPCLHTMVRPCPHHSLYEKRKHA